MSLDAWRARGEAWKRFHAWEKGRPDPSTPDQRLARIAELAAIHRERHADRDWQEDVERIRLTRAILARLA